MTTKSLEEKYKDLEETISDMRHEILRLQAVNEIQNLMGRYEYLHTAGESHHDETAKMFATKTPGVRAELVDSGVYEGVDGIWRLYSKTHRFFDGDRIGRMSIHPLTTSVIEVAGDGKTAQGLWLSPGLETHKVDGTPTGFWVWEKYLVDFVKEDGEWKFWRVHLYRIFHCPYDRSWTEADSEENVSHPYKLPPELRADRPTTYHRPYTPNTKLELVPVPPEPYETWDKSMDCVK